MAPTREKDTTAVLYVGFQDEVAESYVGGQSLATLAFSGEHRVVSNEWVERCESQTIIASPLLTGY